MNRANKKPHSGNCGASSDRRAYQNALHQLYGTPQRDARLPRNWRQRLPDPALYYRRHLDGLARPNEKGWATCRCPFHEDAHASASVNVQTGLFRCHGCGARADLVGFHKRTTGANFKAAVFDLIGGAA